MQLKLSMLPVKHLAAAEAVLDLTTKSADLNAETQRRGDAEEDDGSEIFAPWRLRVFAFFALFAVK